MRNFGLRFHSSKTWVFLGTAAALVGVAIAAATSAFGGPTARSAAVTPVPGQEVGVLNAANQVLIRDCMGRSGFRYWPIPANMIDPSTPFPYVVTNVRWAKEYGLGGYPGGTSGPADPNELYVNSLPAGKQDAYADDLVGPPAGPQVTVALPTGGILGHSALGCQAQANAELYGSFRAWFQASSVASDLPLLSQSMVTNNVSYGRAVVAWSKCMRSKGFPYPSPGQAAAAFRRPAAARPGVLEVRVAVTEAVCAGSTGLGHEASYLNRVFSSLVDQRYQTSLNTEWRLEQSALARAREILAAR
jgi:hypothetical protein